MKEYKNKYNLINEDLLSWLKDKAVKFKNDATGSRETASSPWQSNEPYNTNDSNITGQLDDFGKEIPMRPDFNLYYKDGLDKKQKMQRGSNTLYLPNKNKFDPWFQKDKADAPRPGQITFAMDKPVDMTDSEWKTKSALAKKEAQDKYTKHNYNSWTVTDPEDDEKLIPGPAQIKHKSKWSDEVNRKNTPLPEPYSLDRRPDTEVLFKLDNSDGDNANGLDPLYKGSGPDTSAPYKKTLKHAPNLPKNKKILQRELVNKKPIIKNNKNNNKKGLITRELTLKPSKIKEEVQMVKKPLNEWEYLKYFLEKAEIEDDVDPEDEECLQLPKRSLNEKPNVNPCQHNRVEPTRKGKPLLLGGWTDHK